MAQVLPLVLPPYFLVAVELMADFDPERVISALARKEADGVFMVPLTSDKSLTFHRIFSSDIEANTDSKPSSRMLQRCRSHLKANHRFFGEGLPTDLWLNRGRHRYQFATSGSAS